MENSLLLFDESVVLKDLLDVSETTSKILFEVAMDHSLASAIQTSTPVESCVPLEVDVSPIPASLEVDFEVHSISVIECNDTTNLPDTATHMAQLFGTTDDVSTQQLSFPLQAANTTHISILEHTTNDETQISRDKTAAEGDTDVMDGISWGDELNLADVMEDISWGKSIASEDIAALENDRTRDLCSKCEEKQQWLLDNDDGTQVVCTCDLM